jgi:hypothetical protein
MRNGLLILAFAVTACKSGGGHTTTETPKWRPTPIRRAEEVLPKLTEKHKALSVLEGDWILTGKTYKGSPWGEGEFTGREHNEFMKGGMFLVSKTQYSEQFNNSSQIGFFGVDPRNGHFTFAFYNSLGVIVQVNGILKEEDGTKSVSVSSLVGRTIRWEMPHPPHHPHGGGGVGFGPGKDGNLDFGGDVMRYTTEIISNDEYRFSLSRGGETTYDGVAKRVNSVNP